MDKPSGEPLNKNDLEIAVIGMSGRFPGAPNINEFWEILRNGVESITFLSDRELEEAGISLELIKDPNFVKTNGGDLENREYFDAYFFDYTPHEAEVLNPQTRIFYECSWEALEDAGYNPFATDQLIGVYAGATASLYWQGRAMLSGSLDLVGDFTLPLLTNENNLCTHISYHLNLRGPAVAVQTACSTSLVALHMACQALLNAECDIALAGGATVHFSPAGGYLYQEGMIPSPDGHCRAFDAKARGTASGEGCGVVALKQLKYVIADGDYIHAVIKGTSINNDGLQKVGYTAPSVVGQAEVIRVAHQVAEVESESITYIETHGTGTPLGDLVEIKALIQAFDINKKGYCAIGSVKTNVGHLGSAAGIAGFIKTVLALKHRLIPPSLHFETPNPEIDFENSPFFVNTRLREWKTNGCPLRAGVSSFGIGGTNAHVIVEEAPPQRKSITALPSRQYQLILLSARTETALHKITENLALYLKDNPQLNLTDAAYTLQVGRRALEYRKMLVCSGSEEAVDMLSAPTSEKSYANLVGTEEPPVIFVFSGLGGQYVNMGRDLYEKEPLFRREMDHCFDLLDTLLEEDIKEILYPGSGESEADINRSEWAQVLVFIIEYALAKLLMAWGIEPQSMIGYSFGEYAAACIAGVFSLVDGLQLVVRRGQLMKKAAAGVMLSVPLRAEELTPLLPGDLSLAIDNGPSCIVAGSQEAISVFEKEMKSRRYLTMRLTASHAIHSHMMEPILQEFEEAAGQICLNEPRIPYISNVSGQWITPAEAVNPGYWARHLRSTVRFAEGLRRLLQEPDALFVEVGPGRDIVTLVSRAMESAGQAGFQQRALNLLRNREKRVGDDYYLLHKIGLLWLLGVSIDWRGYYGEEKRYRVPLPTYPFERRRFWKLMDDYKGGVHFRPGRRHGSGKISSQLSHWFYAPSWKRQRLFNATDKNVGSGSCWLVFADSCGLGERLKERLRNPGGSEQQVIIVRPGSGYKRPEPFEYIINPEQYEDYHNLLESLHGEGRFPDRIVHLWGITAAEQQGSELERIERCQAQGFYSLLYLARALGGNGSHRERIEINVVTNNMYEVTGDEALAPGKATVLGPCRVIPQEYAHLSCKSIDVVDFQEKDFVDRLVKEMLVETEDRVVAYRGIHRWVQVFDSVSLPRGERPFFLRKEGVYLIVGGLGDIGFTLAEYLIKSVGARLIITGRTPLPEAEEWDRHLDADDENDKTVRTIRRFKQLRESGGDIFYYCADVSDREGMQEALGCGEAHFGSLNGVIHSAGIVGGESFKPISDIGVSECERQFEAKVYGLLVLEELLRERRLDFCLLVSSISTVLGGLGFAAYSAANHFMDALARQYNRGGQVPWIVVDWDGTGPQDTAAAFQRILSAESIDHVVFSVGGDLEGRISHWVNLAESGGEDEGKGESVTPLYSRPVLPGVYEAPGNAVEQQLADIWQRFFGIDRIGIKDDFFDLGGDSLKMINVISIIHKELKVSVPIKEFFDHPTIERVAVYIAGAETAAYSSIEPVEKRDYYALSSAQRRLYILHRMEPGSTAYNSPQVYLLEGDFDLARLDRAVCRMIVRHESLRTSFVMVSGQPVQRVADELEFKIDYYELESGEIEQGDVIKDFLRPFGLSSAPCFRLVAARLSEGQHLLLFDIHHIITDGVTHEIFSRELMLLYAGEALSPLRIQYKDYSEWQNRADQQALLAQQEAFWLSQFQSSDEIPVLVLPYDYVRPRVQSFEGAVKGFGLSAEESRALADVASAEGVTLYMVLLTIFKLLLYKLSNQEDIVVGTPVAGRRHAELEGVIGFFVNTLPIRSYPESEKTVRSFLREVRETALLAFDNQGYQFEDLVERVAVHRDTGRNPLFDVVFVLQIGQTVTGRTAIAEVDLPGLRLRPYGGYGNNTAKFDLTLNVIESGDRLLLNFEYCSQLFKAATIQRFIHNFRQIVSAVTADIERSISDIEILSAEERHWLLAGFNQAEVNYPQEKSLHRLFGEQAERIPDNIAVVGWGGQKEHEVPDAYRKEKDSTEGLCQLTYRELDHRSTHWACLLREKGATADTIVAVLLERSFEMIVTIIGILKAGAAYLPVDTHSPQERIKFMLEDSDANILVTYAGDVDVDFLASLDLNIISCAEILELWRDSGQSQGLPSQGQLNASNLAYVIYTSGTTGNPKGAMIEHRNVVQLLFNNKFPFDFGSSDVWTLFHSYSFDFSVWEMYGALLYGGELIVISTMTAKDPQTYLEILKTRNVTVLNQTPSAFYSLMNEELKCRRNELSLRYIIFGGEALNPVKLKKWKERYPRTRLVNMYGITETTVHVTFKEIGEAEIQSNVSNTGSPLATLAVCVLDKSMKLVPVGVAGECCVGGQGVGRGYLNRPLLTGEKFVDNPYRAGEILYKSGDLVRLTAGGEMEYLGRMDQQVKIRGFRIELGEIEGQLLKYAAVKEAVVTSQIDEDGERHLYAYIVPHSHDSASTGSPKLNSGELRVHLSQRLPDFMIPSHFILLEQMPLTANGKVDKKVLHSLGTRLDSAVEYTPPGTETEKIIAGVWQEVLQLGKVGVHDKFFDLGGTSLDVVKVTGRLKEIFKKDVPVIRMFLYPTIHSMAAYLRQSRENPDDPGWDGTEGMNIRSDVEIDTSTDLMQEAMQVLGQGDDE